MNDKINKYLYKLSNIDANDSQFGFYLTKLNYWYDQYGGGDNKNCNIHTEKTKCEKAVNEKKEKCAWKFLEADGFTLHDRPPDYRCVNESYKQPADSGCSVLEQRSCLNSIRKIEKQKKDKNGKDVYVDNKRVMETHYVDCKWNTAANKCE